MQKSFKGTEKIVSWYFVMCYAIHATKIVRRKKINTKLSGMVYQNNNIKNKKVLQYLNNNDIFAKKFSYDQNTFWLSGLSLRQ